jgi:hypothetical protein
MTSRTAGEILRGLSLLACAATIFSTTARAETENNGDRKPADSPAAEIEEPADSAVLEHGTNAHILPFREPSGEGAEPVLNNEPTAPSPFGTDPSGRQALVSAHLNYYGGPLISNVKVIKVEYGAGTYQSFISGTGTSSMAGFFTGVTGSAYMSWLSEYNRPGKSIGLGHYVGNFAITPASSRDKATITDANIQAEISAQITAGHLPAPDANTLYMVFFPKGKSISQGGSKSCVAGGFCAYHGTFSRNGQYVYYGVLPDMSAGSGCDAGCGSGSAFANQTSVASHEMIEAVTDPGVGLATSFAAPLAWYDPNNGEIGDICNAQQGSIAGYTVQKEWSNAANACIVHK